MENHKMFGDLDLYEKNAFFQKNRTGTLIRVIEDRRCTVFQAVPTMLLAIIAHVNARKTDG